MITIPEAARRIGRHPETVRRWVRSGRLRSQKVGTQHLIDERDLLAAADDGDGRLPLPSGWSERLPDGSPMPDWPRLVRDSRRAH